MAYFSTVGVDVAAGRTIGAAHPLYRQTVLQPCSASQRLRTKNRFKSSFRGSRVRRTMGVRERKSNIMASERLGRRFPESRYLWRR
jgi:hypothetical protein